MCVCVRAYSTTEHILCVFQISTAEREAATAAEKNSPTAVYATPYDEDDDDERNNLRR